MAARVGQRWLSVLLAAYLAVAVATAAVEGWWYWPGREKYAVAVPAPSASRRRVVLAYLRALDAHDRATACAVSTPAFRSTVALWLSSTASITCRRDRNPLKLPTPEPRHAGLGDSPAAKPHPAARARLREPAS